MTNSAISDYERGKVDPQSQTLRKLLRGPDLPVSILDPTQTETVRVPSDLWLRAMTARVPGSALKRAEFRADRQTVVLSG